MDADTEQVEMRLDPRVFSASPEAATTGIGWRAQLRGRIGVTIPIVSASEEADEGFALRLPAFIELYNHWSSAVPYQFWRGRLVLDGSLAWRTLAADSGAPLVRVGLAVEHESDHASVSTYPGFLNLNSVAVHGDVVVPFGERTTFYASALARLHFLTCTVDPILCGAGEGGRGARAFETTLEASVDHALSPASDANVWMLFAAAYASWLPPTDIVRGERRATFEAGGALATSRRGTFQLFATSLFGDDVGYFRGRDSVVQAGGGFRWTP